jgi:hypothetical protein
MASKWGGIKSPKILDALRVALSDDKMFSHREVVDVIRAALDDGYLTPSELNDLRIVADNSETMLPRPRAMFDVDDVKVGYSASATIGDIEKWFIHSGYTDVKYESAPVYGLDPSDIDDLNRYYSDGRRVVLRTNSTMLYGAKQSDITYHGNHLVVLHSSIARTPQGVRLTIFTWGQGNFVIPQGTPLSEHDFLNNLYGYVAGKPF